MPTAAGYCPCFNAWQRKVIVTQMIPVLFFIGFAACSVLILAVLGFGLAVAAKAGDAHYESAILGARNMFKTTLERLFAYEAGLLPEQKAAPSTAEQVKASNKDAKQLAFYLGAQAKQKRLDVRRESLV
jgi:hypothetical protein